VRTIEHLGDFTNDGRTSGIRELGQLLEMLVQQMPRARRLDGRAYQYRTLSGRMKIDGVS